MEGGGKESEREGRRKCGREGGREHRRVDKKEEEKIGVRMEREREGRRVRLQQYWSFPHTNLYLQHTMWRKINLECCTL